MNILQDARNAIVRSAQLHDRESKSLPREVRVARERELTADWVRLAAIEAGMNPFPTHITVAAGASAGGGPDEYGKEVRSWNS